MKAIIYESGTGFTERYAKMLSEKLDIPAYTIKEGKKSTAKGDEILFMGWVFANKISGLDKAHKQWKVIAAAAVGMNPKSDENTKIVKEANKLEIPLFYLWGGLNKEKLKGINKMMLGFVRDSLAKQNKPELHDAIELFDNGGDFVSEENLSELIAFALTQI